MCGSRGGGGKQGVRTPPLKNHKQFPSQTGPDPLEITKLPNQHSRMGHFRPACETPFQWRFAGRPIIVRFWWCLVPLSPKKQQKTYQSWTPSDKTFWIRTCQTN